MRVCAPVLMKGDRRRCFLISVEKLSGLATREE